MSKEMKMLCPDDVGLSPKKDDYWKKNGVMYLIKKVVDDIPNTTNCDVYKVEVDKVVDTGQKCWS